MSDQSTLKIHKEVKGKALIDLGQHGTATFEDVSVYLNDWSEKDMVIMVVDKSNPDHKIQITLEKPTEFIEVKKEETPESSDNTAK